MRNVSWSATHTDLVLLLAEQLHSPVFMGGDSTPMNFHVHLLKDKIYSGRLHRGMGFLTVPTREVGDRFLLYAAAGLGLRDKRISFSKSNAPAGRPDVIQTITKMPYVDPRIQESERQKSEELSASRVSLRTIQFGWDCRDHVMSIESEASPGDCHLSFDEERRQFRVEFIHQCYKYFIAVRFSQIEFLTAHNYLHNEPVIVLTLLDSPTYEQDLKPCKINANDEVDFLADALRRIMFAAPDNNGPRRKQLSFLPLPLNHESVAPYTGLALRLVCATRRDLEKFRNLSNSAGFHHIGSDEYRVERRGLFSSEALEDYNRWTRALPWTIAFQVIAIVNKRSVDVTEMVDILPHIQRLRRDKGNKYVASLLQDFAPKVFALYRSDKPEDSAPDAVRRCFAKAVQDFDALPPRRNVNPTDGSLCEVFHVTITPTSMVLDGPTPERSNRVIRAYPEEHQESFLRVTFAEEGRLQFRFDKEVDSRAYLQDRVGPILFDGLTIAQRTFHFLAYSQSALKEHSVW